MMLTQNYKFYHCFYMNTLISVNRSLKGAYFVIIQVSSVGYYHET